MALHKAVITCMLPSLLYRAEIWYSGCTKPGQHAHMPTVSACIGWHVNITEKTLVLAICGVLPVYHTTLTVTLFQDSGLPPAEAALDEVCICFAIQLQLTDEWNLIIS